MGIQPLIPFFYLTCCIRFARASITKYHELGDFNKRHLFYHKLGGYKSKIKVTVDFLSFEASFLD